MLFVAAFCASGQAQPPDSSKKSADTKTTSGTLPVVKLPDGTFLWVGTPTDAGGGRIALTLAEFQKIQEQFDQLKKQLAASQKPPAPSECVVRGRIEKRGEQLVAVLKLHYSFRTSLPLTTIALGARKGFLVSAALDGTKLPVLETTDEGYAAYIETAGDHTITLEILVPITARGANAKTEIGFEIGLPRSPITLFALEPHTPDLKRVILTTRTPDPSQPTPPNRPPERRILELKQLQIKSDQEKGLALGPVETLEVTWEPLANAAQPIEQVQSAEFDISVLFSERIVETTAKIKLHGSARLWRLIAPQDAELSAERAIGTTEVDTSPPVSIKPTEQNKPVWRIEFPVGANTNDWVIIAVTRQMRGRSEDPKYRGPFPIGPFSVLEVFRQTGTVRVTAGPHTQFVCKHGLDLRQTLVPGPVEDDVTNSFFRLITGPTGTTPPNLPQPMISIEAFPQVESIAVKPTYKFTLEKVPLSDEVVWRIRAEIRVSPNHKTVDAIVVEIPQDWEGTDSSLPSELAPVVFGVKSEGFWSSMAARVTKSLRVPTILHLPTAQKQAFDLILTASVRVHPGTNKIAIPLPKFPSLFERDVTVAATVPEGLEIRESEARGMDGDSSGGRSINLSPILGPNSKPSKIITAVKGESEAALSQVILGWNIARPDMTAEISAEATLADHQTQISEQIRLRSVDGLPRMVRLHPAPNGITIAGLKVAKGQVQSQPGSPEWTIAIPPETKELLVDLSYAIPLDRKLLDQTSWNLPIGLLWPVGATQTDTTVRIWSNTTNSRKITNLSMDWRELPTEPAVNREVIPSLVLAASSSEIPLVVEAREISDQSSVAVWVNRASIQAWGSEDGATHYRARFLIQKWLGPAIEVRLPIASVASTCEFLADGLRIADITPIADIPGKNRVFRVHLDTFVGKSVLLEVRYQLPVDRGEIGEEVYIPAQISNASYATPIRWLITVPHGMIPLLTSGATPEFHWRLLTGGLVPVPVRSSEDDHFVGESINTQGDSVTTRQAIPAPIIIYRFPRNGFVMLCSVVFLFTFLVLTRLTLAAIGPTVAILGLLTGIAAILFPHAAAQVAGACQPGLALALVVLLSQAAIRSYYRHRANHLPGFARTPIEPSGPKLPLPSSTRGKPSGTGSALATPVAPTGE